MRARHLQREDDAGGEGEGEGGGGGRGAGSCLEANAGILDNDTIFGFETKCVTGEEVDVGRRLLRLYMRP